MVAAAQNADSKIETSNQEDIKQLRLEIDRLKQIVSQTTSSLRTAEYNIAQLEAHIQRVYTKERTPAEKVPVPKAVQEPPKASTPTPVTEHQQHNNTNNNNQKKKMTYGRKTPFSTVDQRETETPKPRSSSGMSLTMIPKRKNRWKTSSTSLPHTITSQWTSTTVLDLNVERNKTIQHRQSSYPSQPEQERQPSEPNMSKDLLWPQSSLGCMSTSNTKAQRQSTSMKISPEHKTNYIMLQENSRKSTTTASAGLKTAMCSSEKHLARESSKSPT